MYKKSLFYNLKAYYESQNVDPFRRIPLTFHVEEGMRKLEEWNKFQEVSVKLANKKKDKNKEYFNVWIVKPGENSNRGKGIRVFNNFEQIKKWVG
jgi:tubulin--tyrosine ligase